MPDTTIPQLVDGSGAVLAQGAGSPGGHELRLLPGDKLSSEVDVANVCATTVVPPVTIAYELGGGRRDRVEAAQADRLDRSALQRSRPAGEHPDEGLDALT